MHRRIKRHNQEKVRDGMGRTGEDSKSAPDSPGKSQLRPDRLECVLLVQHPERAGPLESSLARAGVRFHVAETIGFARLLLALTRSRVLLAEAVPEDPHWMAELCLVAQRRTEAAWVALLAEFDSDKWMEMVDRGACDVVCPPYSPDSLARIVAAAERYALGSPEAVPHRGLRPLRGWVFRFRNLLLLRAR